MEQVQDRRVRKTKQAMVKALAKLLSEKPLNHISVREISELADINRGTFYLHYRDVYDMVTQLQNGIFEKFEEIVEKNEPQKSSGELFPLLAELFQLLAENAELARVLLGKNGDAAFIDKLKQVIREKCFTNAAETFTFRSEDEFDYFFHYIVSGCIGICSAWLNNGMKESTTEMAAFTEQLITRGSLALKQNRQQKR